MKCILVLFSCVAATFAQGTTAPPNFTTGQAARAVIGQETFTAGDPNSSDTTIGAASGVAYAADTLFVADSNRIGALPSNHRVLLFQGLSSMLPSPTAELANNSKCPVCVGRATVVLGQPDFNSSTLSFNATPNSLRLATAVASDGVHLVVADTDHNRVLIWNRLPTTINSPADVVVGQANFTSASVPTSHVPTASSLSGPQGVWVQNGKLYVADTQNNRILIWNRIPTGNGAAADVVLGQPNFTSYVQVDATQQNVVPSPANMLSPVSVTSDGTHVFVSDLGWSRVLIWNSIPTTNGANADVEIGQPDFTTGAANDGFSTNTDGTQTAVLCTVSNGTDSTHNNSPTYPSTCNGTLNFPRFALAAGGRLFVADGGNDRVLEFNQIPTKNAQAADEILGQIGGSVDQATDASDSMNTPTSLAWDGANLYVADPYNRRIMVYTIAPNILPYQAVRNTASFAIYATGTVTIGGTIHAGDKITLTINTATYPYTVKATDTIDDVIAGLVASIQTSNSGAGDPNVSATADDINSLVLLRALTPGTDGNNVSYSVALSSSPQIAAVAGNATLLGGGDAAKVAPGTLVSLVGTNLANGTYVADTPQGNWPTELGGTEVYFNGVRAPLIYVSPTQINTQIPWEVDITGVNANTGSINAYVRTVQPNGQVMVTSPVSVTIVPANPGIFGQQGSFNPQVGIVLHGSSNAVGVVDMSTGTITAGDILTITVQENTYSYTVQSTDTLDTVCAALAAVVNNDPLVSATVSGQYQRVILRARIPGPDGNGIAYSAASTSKSGGSGSSTITVTPLGSNLCCANVKGAMVTTDNPALPGETVTVYATGLGVPVITGDNQPGIVTGQPYPVGFPVTNPPAPSAVSSLAAGTTADVLTATLKPGAVGIFEVLLHLNSGLATNNATPLTIAQDVYLSNSVVFAVLNPGTQ